MGSKEAVGAVLARRRPEYIPLGAYAIDCDTARRVLGHETYVRDKVRTQLALWAGRRDEVAQSLKEDSVALFRKLPAIDVILPFKEAPLLPPKGYEPPKIKKLSDNTWEDPQGNVYRASFATNDISVVRHAPPPGLADFLRAPAAAPPDGSIFEAYDHLIAHMKDSRFLAGLSGGFNPMPLLGGMEEGLALYLLEPELVHAAIAYYDRQARLLDPYYIRPGIDQIFVEADLATTRAPLLSPDTFREFCFEPMRRRVGTLKTYREHVLLHSCGNSWMLLDMLADTGISLYQSLQTGAGMELGLLKAKYGRRMAFWGGVAVEHLVAGTPEEVRADVRRAMEEGGPDGGFILGPSHSVAYGTKYDNFMAMLEEHDKLKYRF